MFCKRINIRRSEYVMFASTLAGMTLFGTLAIADPEDRADISAEKLHRAIEEQVPEAARFAADVAARAEAYSKDAELLGRSGFNRMEQQGPDDKSGVGGLATMAPALAAVRKERSKPAGVLVFASLSMPREALAALVRDADRAQVPVVLRGFVKGSLSQTAKVMHEIVRAAGGETTSGLGGVLIDPRAFRVFKVDQVPTFISINGPLPECRGLDCAVDVPPHDRIAGNMSLKAALEALTRQGFDAPLQAGAALARLEERP